MSLEKKLTEVVESANKLTQTVSEKQQVIDNRMTQMAERVNEHIAEIDSHLPRVCITNNPCLDEDAETGLPHGISIHADLAVEKVITISGNPNNRSPEEISILREIELDLDTDLRIDHHYRKSFNIYRFTWNKESSIGSWLLFPNSVHLDGSIPNNTLCTIGALVKVVSGEISRYWGHNCIQNKWHFNYSRYAPVNMFGHYFHPHPIRQTTSGEVLVALPAVTTGVVDDIKSWFPLVELVKE